MFPGKVFRGKVAMGRKIELLCAFAALLWGFWVGSPFWETFITSSVFVKMAQIAPEWIWGSVVFCLGLAQLVAALRRISARMRQWVAAAGVFVWMTIALFYFFGNPYSTGFTAYAIYVLMNLIVLIENGAYR